MGVERHIIYATSRLPTHPSPPERNLKNENAYFPRNTQSVIFRARNLVGSREICTFSEIPGPKLGFPGRIVNVPKTRAGLCTGEERRERFVQKTSEIRPEPGSAQGREEEEETESFPDSGPGIPKIPFWGGEGVGPGWDHICNHPAPTSHLPPPESSLKNEKREFLRKYACLKFLSQTST